MAYGGDTVRLQVKFRDFNDIAVNPTNIKLTTYDTNKNQIDQININDTNKVDVGVYFYDYVLPVNKTEIIFEFKGTHNEKPILTRGNIPIKI
ncbi:hypothetical protein LAV77_04990 [Priestia megaterium]|uniref:hypothetical protein n=1 Tax=Priestia megaterium TaxID=1404 RepID=UPI002B24E726|nr:hypothetical protein [Priestia megaterium]MEB2264150.1 hypothetical protein [Priestia megaterium]